MIWSSETSSGSGVVPAVASRAGDPQGDAMREPGRRGGHETLPLCEESKGPDWCLAVPPEECYATDFAGYRACCIVAGNVGVGNIHLIQVLPGMVRDERRHLYTR